MSNQRSRYWPTRPVAPEREAQRDAADDRRQHHRQDARTRARSTLPAELGAGEHPRDRQRRTAIARAGRGERALEREAERGTRVGIGEVDQSSRHGARCTSPASGATKNTSRPTTAMHDDERGWPGAARAPAAGSRREEPVLLLQRLLARARCHEVDPCVGQCGVLGVLQRRDRECRHHILVGRGSRRRSTLPRRPSRR